MTTGPNLFKGRTGMALAVYYLLLLGLAGHTTAGLAPYAPPPMYRIRASSLYDAGLQQGQLARDRIRGWLASPEMTALLNYTVTDGASVFAELKETNTAAHSARAGFGARGPCSRC